MEQPGALIELDGTLNLRDLGGWAADGGEVSRGRLYRCDRLSELSDADLGTLDQLGVRTVIDLRHEGEVAADVTRLWSGVEHHVNVPMAGELADRRTFMERALGGEYDGITDADVGADYIELLQRHAGDYGKAITLAVAEAPSLFHCTAGKDRTGLFAMLVLDALGVSNEDILTDFTLSNLYRAEKRMEALRPVFAEHDLDVEDFRPALSAPRQAMEMAIDWIESTHGGASGYLTGPAAMSASELAHMREVLITAS